ncbi:hypothetical protein EDC01DRAFT_782001 [Geopyxis carbonaria]|nr:hypothetical protein EDC01DRAFT_782001 [Geopyxis carbonaria]
MHPPVSTCTRRVRLPYAVESAYPTLSKPSPSRRVRLRCQHSIRRPGAAYADIPTQDAPAGVKLLPSSPPTLSGAANEAESSSPPTLSKLPPLSPRCQHSIRRPGAVSTPFLLKMHPPVSSCSRRVRLPYAVSTQFVTGDKMHPVAEAESSIRLPYGFEVESAYAVSTLFIPRCTRRCQVAPVESAYAVSTQFVTGDKMHPVAEAESSIF